VLMFSVIPSTNCIKEFVHSATRQNFLKQFPRSVLHAGGNM